MNLIYIIHLIIVLIGNTGIFGYSIGQLAKNNMLGNGKHARLSNAIVFFLQSAVCKLAWP